MENSIPAATHQNTKEVRENGNIFLPFFVKLDDVNPPLIPVITVDHASQKILMMAYMSETSLNKTLEMREVYYWSRSRRELWHKGATSGQIQKLINIAVDCDQDCLLIEVLVEGDGGCCHLGEQSCFHRMVDLDSKTKLIKDDGKSN